MNSTELRSKNGWGRGLVDWADGDTAYVSVVFSWMLDKALARASELSSQGYTVRIGGPAARFAGLSDVGLSVPVVQRHNLDACFTSHGCVNRCGFCVVGQTEGDLVEDDNFEPRRIICDNNLTACSKKHFDLVIDRSKHLHNMDINQGISAALVTDYQASRLAELDLDCIRLAWDSAAYESQFMRGWDILRRAGFSRSKISVYILIGYNDTPADALYRLEMVRRLGGMPFPMRYQPLDTLKRNAFVGENWTHNELVRYCRYWANLRITSKIPFADFEYKTKKDGVNDVG